MGGQNYNTDLTFNDVSKAENTTTKVKPLLIVKAPVGKMTHDKAQEYLRNFNNGIKSAFKDEYNTIIVPTRGEEYIFETAFAPNDVVEKVINLEEIKKLIQEYLKND